MSVHIPVLMNEVVEWLDLHPDDVVVDGTINGGGHASKIVSFLGSNGVFVGIN